METRCAFLGFIKQEQGPLFIYLNSLWVTAPLQKQGGAVRRISLPCVGQEVATPKAS